MPLAAPLGRRVAARVIDVCLALLVLYIVSRVVPAPRLLGRLALALAALSAYEALFVAHLRATPGKMATALRVAQVDRHQVDPVAAWSRGVVSAIATLATAMVPAALAVMTDSAAGLILGGLVVAVVGGAFLSMATAPLRRGIADRIADTVVVPFEAPEVVTRAQVEAEGHAERPRPITAWGPVAPVEARRRGRAGRLDDSPVLVLLLVGVLLAWSVDRPAVAIALACAWAAVLVVDEAIKVARDGGTGGHRAAGLAVLDEATGEPPGFGASLARAAVLAVFWLFPPLLPVLGLWMRLSPTVRGPHDLVAGTVVVDTTGAP